MNNLYYIFQLALLIVIQVVVLNKINFSGYADPMLYLCFFMTYPVRQYNGVLLLLATLSGFIMDWFSDTGGVYACATLCVTFIRPLLIRVFFGQNFENQSINLLQVSVGIRILYILLFVFIFQILFYLFEIFSFQQFIYAFDKIIVSTLITFIFCFLFFHIFGKNKK
ncbi:MAG: rod shape-determining protein MreD [Capnocytophaga sp.]|nr:rod shape-determining protein MreD [Capnocytophaga sp.]